MDAGTTVVAVVAIICGTILVFAWIVGRYANKEDKK